MSAEVYKMICEQPKYTIEQLNSKLKKELSGELVSCIVRKSNDCIVSMCNFEKYFFRNGDMAALAIMITEVQGVQSVDIVGYGGGRGLLNFSLGANSDFAYDAMKYFTKLGFKKQS